MKSLYLILVTAAAVVTCKPQRSNDIIWYPVDDEDGVFISTFGEKHRSSNNGKWRSHRRARYSGMEQPLPLSYDPSENYDPSFFHNIHQRRTMASVGAIPKFPPSFQDQQFPVKRPNKRPRGQGNQNLNGNNYQQILNEVFDYNRNPTTGQGNANLWDARPTNQWGGDFFNGNNNQWNGGQQRPGNQWGNTVNPVKRPQRPGKPNNSGQRPSATRPTEKPTSEWITPDTRPGSKRPNRPTGQSDKLVFPEQANTSSRPTTTPSAMLPTDPPTLSPCELSCPVTPEFNPVCGSDSVTYSNAGRLKCAQMCGKDVRLSHYGNCGRTPFSTPLVSSNPRIFW